MWWLLPGQQHNEDFSAELSWLSSSSPPPLCHRESALLSSSLHLSLASSCASFPSCTSFAFLCAFFTLEHFLRRTAPPLPVTTTNPHTAALFSGSSYPRVLLLSLRPVKHLSPALQKGGQRTRGRWTLHSPCSLHGILYMHAAVECVSLHRQPNGIQFSNVQCLKCSTSSLSLSPKYQPGVGGEVCRGSSEIALAAAAGRCRDRLQQNKASFIYN